MKEPCTSNDSGLRKTRTDVNTPAEISINLDFVQTRDVPGGFVSQINDDVYLSQGTVGQRQGNWYHT